MTPLQLVETPVEPAAPPRRLKVLFFVEGFTDIRFVVGLSQICDLTMAIPARTYASSGLKARVEESGAKLSVDEIPGGRLAFQIRSLGYLLRRAGGFDVILAQEVLRGALNATLAGLVRRVPVVTYMGIAPAEYFQCRRERKQIGGLKWFIGDRVIRTLMSLNGMLASRCLAMGPYLRDIARRYCTRSENGLYYGVDTELFQPVNGDVRMRLRRSLQLPAESFLVLFSSRISHEKDPETFLQAAAEARKNGLNLVVLNLGGGFRDFIALAHRLGLPNVDAWVLGGPAVHPMKDLCRYYQAADALVQSSLAEGLGLSPLEALACGVPVVATAVGGLAAHLQEYARLTPRQDVEAMSREIQWIAANPDEARSQALRAREQYIVPEWSREKAFADLEMVLQTVVK